MSILTMLSAGLIDGINTCGIAAVVFLISFLSFIGRKPKELLVVGIAYTTAVFITYYLIGIGLFSIIRSFTFIPLIKKILFSIVGLLTIILGIISVYDYRKFKRGVYTEAKLQLPRFLKQRIHTDIREKSKMSNYILAAFIIGFLVAISEFVCTVQVYFPVITFMVTQFQSMKLKCLTYLFIYNLAQILPLVLVFVAVFKGRTSADLNLFWKRHGAMAKLLTTILFFVLGGLLIFYAFF